MDIDQLKDLCAKNFDVDYKEIQVLPYDGNLFGAKAENFLFLIKKGNTDCYVLFPIKGYEIAETMGNLINYLNFSYLGISKASTSFLFSIELNNNNFFSAYAFDLTTFSELRTIFKNLNRWDEHNLPKQPFYRFLNEILPPIPDSKRISLKKLKLLKIGHFSSFSIDLTKQIICLLGHNGSGKTTILRAIALGLTGVDGNTEIQRHHSEIERLLNITVSSNTQQDFTFNSTQALNSIEFEKKGAIELSYSFNDQDAINIITFNGGNHGVSVHDENANAKNSFLFTYNKNLFKHLFLGIPQLQTKSQKETAFKPSKKPHIQDVIDLIYDEAADHFQSLKEWLKALHGDGKIEVLKFVLKVIGDIIEQPLQLENVLHQDNQIILKIGDDLVLFDLLSQGFRNVFSWVGHFMKRLAESNDFAADFNTKPALVLVDEIDTYLHPRWQRTILDKLAENFPNTQFIVSTHSPLVASYVEAQGRKAVVYVIDKEADKPREFKQAYGRDIRSIFWDWMKVEERPTELQARIDEILSLIDEETAESLQKATEAYKKLDLPEDDAIMLEIRLSLDMAREHLLNA